MIRWAIWIAALCLLGLSGRVQAEPYILGPEDVISFRVATWDDATATYIPMQAVSGDYRLGADGTMSLPVVGDVMAAGQTPSELGALVAAQLQSAVGLFQLPAVSLQVIEYRPFYISGDVGSPGSYPWRPQLTAAKALALAGGVMRPRQDILDATSAFRDVNQLQAVQAELAQLQLRAARLEAELSDAPEISFPQDIPHPDGEAVITRIMADEQSRMQLRRGSLARAVESHEALIALYQTELTSLESKLGAQQRQLTLTQEQVENLRSLEERGLVPASRLIAVEQNLMDQSAEELDLNTAIYRARQRIGETQRDLQQITDSRRQEVMAELQSTRHDIILQSKRAEMLAALAAFSGLRPVNTSVDVGLQVRRDGDGATRVLDLSPDDPVLPGDVVEVTLTLQAAAP